MEAERPTKRARLSARPRATTLVGDLWDRLVRRMVADLNLLHFGDPENSPAPILLAQLSGVCREVRGLFLKPRTRAEPGPWNSMNRPYLLGRRSGRLTDPKFKDRWYPRVELEICSSGNFQVGYAPVEGVVQRVRGSRWALGGEGSSAAALLAWCLNRLGDGGAFARLALFVDLHCGVFSRRLVLDGTPHTLTVGEAAPTLSRATVVCAQGGSLSFDSEGNAARQNDLLSALCGVPFVSLERFDDVVDLTLLAPACGVALKWCSRVTDVAPLARARRVALCWCEGVQDVSPLAGVETLDLQFLNGVKEVGALARVHTLKLSGVPKNATALSKLSGVCSLTLNDLRLLRDVSGVVGVRDVSVFVSLKLVDVSPMARCRKVCLDRCGVRDVSPLAGVDTVTLSNCYDATNAEEQLRGKVPHLEIHNWFDAIAL